MKVFQSIAVLAALVVASADDAEVKQLYHVTVPKSVMDTAQASFGDELDIWDATVKGDNVQADIYATPSTIQKFQGADLHESSSQVVIEKDAVSTAAFFAERAVIRAACTQNTLNHLNELGDKYTDNAFFDCWRTADEVFQFLDSLASENPAVFTKIDSVSKSVEGRAIPAYKISTGANGGAKKSLYTQGLIHAREWHAGSTTFFAIASLLDGLRSGDATIQSIFDKYDWYFVPIVNIDGYVHTWNPSGDRLWRKNRKPITSNGRKYYGVDLNRNWGPKEFFNLDGQPPRAETYPGDKPLSEPETAGLYKWIKTLPNLAGALDIHAYSGLVLRPFGNQRAQAAAPWGGKLKALGDHVRDAIMANNDQSYTSQTAAQLYLAYGSFMDSIFLEFNKTATLSFEMEGNNFEQPESVIRPGGTHIFQGLLQFVQELQAYYK